MKSSIKSFIHNNYNFIIKLSIIGVLCCIIYVLYYKTNESFVTTTSTATTTTLIPTTTTKPILYNLFNSSRRTGVCIVPDGIAYANITVIGVKGGDNTVKGENGGYVNQFGDAAAYLTLNVGGLSKKVGLSSFGLGVDYDFTSTGSLHLRHKWFGHKDANFIKDKFKGQETYLELKVFF